jgi:hypothetical protein
MAQAGYPSEGVLEERTSYLPTHFIIFEPGSYSDWIRPRTHDVPDTEKSQMLFYYRQPPIKNLLENKQFGKSFQVDYYLSTHLDK